VSANTSYYEGQFVPLPELRAADADIGLVFVSANDIMYDAPTNDDLYAAHTPAIASIGMRGCNITRTFYTRDEPARVLGCVERYQSCDVQSAAHSANANSGGGTSFAGLTRSLLQAKTLWRARNPRLARLFDWVFAGLAADPLHVWTVPLMLGQSALTARYSLGNGLQGPLPDDQWQREVQFWFKTSLAHIQRVVLETATGPLGPMLNRALIRPQTAEERLLCQSQVGLAVSYNQLSLFSVFLFSLFITQVLTLQKTACLIFLCDLRAPGANAVACEELVGLKKLDVAIEDPQRRLHLV
jgi:hypothetical protein